jgi:hypothetical protein
MHRLQRDGQLGRWTDQDLPAKLRIASAHVFAVFANDFCSAEWYERLLQVKALSHGTRPAAMAALRLLAA